MICFEDLFRKSKGKPVKYKDQTIVLADKFPALDGDKLVISIEKTNSKYIQGLSIDITGSCEMDGEIFQSGEGANMVFWEDSEALDIKHIEMIIHTKKDFIWIKNLWEVESHYLVADESGKHIKKPIKTTESCHNGAAMIVEEIENGKRYRCNDGEPDDDFDDIIFTIKKVGNMKEKPLV